MLQRPYGLGLGVFGMPESRRGLWRQCDMTITTKCRIGIDTDGKITGRGRHIADRERDYRKKKRDEKIGERDQTSVFRVDSPACAVQPRNGTVVRALARGAEWTRTA